ncbi:phosphatidate cytidylyltransferase [Fibrobacterota bacterium]
MSNLTIRIITALALIVISFSALLWSPLSRWALITLFLCLAAWEFSRMVFIRYTSESPSWPAWTASLLTFLLLAPHAPLMTGCLPGSHEAWLWLVLIVATAIYTCYGFALVPIEKMSPWILLNIFSVLLFGIWAGKIFQLINYSPGFAGISSFLLVIICMVSADTGAYFTGRSFGKHKLCPAISPNKTWEGLLGGSLLTILLTSFLGPALTAMNSLESLLFGLLMSVTAVMGDLSFSSFKRYAGVKDTSHIIPGHGGIIDRFDSLFLSIPIAVLYFNLV